MTSPEGDQHDQAQGGDTIAPEAASLETNLEALTNLPPTLTAWMTAMQETQNLMMKALTEMTQNKGDRPAAPMTAPANEHTSAIVRSAPNPYESTGPNMCPAEIPTTQGREGNVAPIVSTIEADVTAPFFQTPQNSSGARRHLVFQESTPAQDWASDKQETFVTRAELETYMARKVLDPSGFSFDLRPPYPARVATKPYPKGYIPPLTFPQYTGKGGNAQVHLRRFRDVLGSFAADGELCMKEFCKTLDDRAYLWYSNLPPLSLNTWEEMTQSFLSKFFTVEEKVSIMDLGRERQGSNEDLNEYVRRFRERALDCPEPISEGALVNICVSGISNEYRIFLENLGIRSFAHLIESAKRTAISVKRTAKQEHRPLEEEIS